MVQDMIIITYLSMEKWTLIYGTGYVNNYLQYHSMEEQTLLLTGTMTYARQKKILLLFKTYNYLQNIALIIYLSYRTW